MANGLYLYSTFLVVMTTQSAFTLRLIDPFTYIHTLMTEATTQAVNLLIRGKLAIHTPLAQQQEQFEVKFLAQGHINIWM